jgi:hypothetical protein
MAGIPRGAIRFNTDSNKPELWDGSQWAEFQLSTPNLAEAGDVSIGARGLFMGGENPDGRSKVIDAINFASTGSEFDFGDLVSARSNVGVFASSTRGIAAGGEQPTVLDTIDQITIASKGDAVDFGGTLTDARRRLSEQCNSNETRGMICGGYDGSNQLNLVDYITIPSGGNASDFGGDLTATSVYGGNVVTPTRMVIAGGNTTTRVSTMQYVNFTSTGNNFQNFGDLTADKQAMGAASNAVRGIWAGGQTPSVTGVIEYMTMASLGNSTLFGDLVTAEGACAGCASPTRMAVGGGDGPSNVIQYFDIMTEGNSVDFGDLSTARQFLSATSNAHGGL